MTATPAIELDPQAAKTWLDAGDTIIVDVREPGEHAREHLDMSRLMPLASLDPARIDLGTARRVLFVCASGMRSGRAAAQFAAARDVPVANLKGGLAAWKAAGFPVRTNSAAPLPIMRQVQIAAGALILVGAALGTFVHPGFYGLCAFVGAGLFFAGATGWCGMATMLSYLPYNRRAA